MDEATPGEKHLVQTEQAARHLSFISSDWMTLKQHCSWMNKLYEHAIKALKRIEDLKNHECWPVNSVVLSFKHCFKQPKLSIPDNTHVSISASDGCVGFCSERLTAQVDFLWSSALLQMFYMAPFWVSPLFQSATLSLDASECDISELKVSAAIIQGRLNLLAARSHVENVWTKHMAFLAVVKVK